MRWLELFVFACSAMLALGFVAFPEAHQEKGVAIVVESESAEGIEAPLEIRRDPDDASVRYLHVPEIRIKDELGRLASPPRMRFTVPSAGPYYLWARTRWHDTCGNSFYLELDGGSPFLFGNDENFGRWHWVRYELPINLAAGSHELSIPISEANIDIDRLLVADRADPQLPYGREGGFAGDFSTGDASGWRPQTAAAWSTTSDATGARTVYRLAPRAGEDLEYAVHEGAPLQGDVHLTVMARRGPGDAAARDLAAIFDYRDASTFRYLKLASEGVVLGTVAGGRATETPMGPLPSGAAGFLRGDRSSEVDLRVSGNRLLSWVDGEALPEIALPQRVKGAVGVGSRTGGIDVERAEAHVVGEAPALSNTFYIDHRPLAFIEGFTPVTGQWRRSHVFSSPITYTLESRAEEGRAVAVTGERWWTEYRFSAAVRTRADAWAGLVFQYRTPDDYLLVRGQASAAPGASGPVELVQRRGGSETVLARGRADVRSGQWSVFEVEATARGTTAFIDGRAVLESNETGAAPGRVGLAAEAGASGEPPERQPVFFLEGESSTADTYSFDLDVIASDPDRGTILLLDYVDEANTYLWAFVRDGEDVLSRLGKVVEGEASVTAERRFPAAAGNYRLEVAVQSGHLRTFIGDQLFGALAEPIPHGSRFGLMGTMPGAHADFDEVRVTAPGPGTSPSGPHAYEFNPARQAAHDLAAWPAESGTLGIGFFRCELFYKLIARTGEERRATIVRRAPLAGKLQELSVALLVPKLDAERVVIAFGREESASSLRLTLEYAPAPGAPGDPPHEQAVQAVLALERDGGETARKPVPGTLTGSTWQALALAVADDEVVASFGGEKLLSVPGPAPAAGERVSITVMGPEGTIVGFREIRMDEGS